jgi:hypothetical protein
MSDVSGITNDDNGASKKAIILCGQRLENDGVY